MDELIVQILRGFGLKPHSISRHKLSHICLTDKGMKTLRQAGKNHRETIFFQHEVKENLFAKGFKDIDRFNVSAKNEPFFAIDGKVYTMSDYLPCKESSFSNHDDFERIIKKIAEMHSIKLIPKEKFNLSANLFEEQFVKDMSCLNEFKKRISKNNKFSDFDVIFCKNYNYYIECLDQWFNLIKEINYADMLETVINKGSICHNMLKESTVLTDGATFYITNFSECSYGHYISDLASLIKRHFKSRPGNNISIKKILEIYNSVSPLNEKDIKLLYSLLIYPDKFIKTALQYYAKKRSWTPGSFKNRIESVIVLKDVYRKYIDESIK